MGGGGIVFHARIIVNIPAGYKSVIYRPFSGGVDLSYVYGEGIHVLWPFNMMTSYNIAMNVHKMEMEILTKDLVKSKVSLSFQYSANPLTLPTLHRYVGKNYMEIYILPVLTAVVRGAFGNLTSQEAFTVDLKQVAMDVTEGTENYLIQNLSPAGLSTIRLVFINSFQIEDVVFPPEIQASINNKIVQSSASEAMVYKIQITQQEASRKVIEAQGIKKYQDIVNSGMTENYLRHEGIQASLKLAESSNAKVIMFGSPAAGLPLILGDVGAGVGGIAVNTSATAEVAKNPAGTTQPPQVSTQPETSKPSSASTQPETVPAKLPAVVSEPQTSPAKPSSAASQPQTVPVQPPAGVTPPLKVPSPPAETTKPQTQPSKASSQVK